MLNYHHIFLTCFTGNYRPVPVLKQFSFLGMGKVHHARGFQRCIKRLSHQKQVLH
jgi:hypothetical protein